MYGCSDSLTRLIRWRKLTTGVPLNFFSCTLYRSSYPNVASHASTCAFYHMLTSVAACCTAPQCCRMTAKGPGAVA